MKLLVLCPQSEGKWFSAGICRITFLGGSQLDRAQQAGLGACLLSKTSTRNQWYGLLLTSTASKVPHWV